MMSVTRMKYKHLVVSINFLQEILVEAKFRDKLHKVFQEFDKTLDKEFRNKKQLIQEKVFDHTMYVASKAADVIYIINPKYNLTKKVKDMNFGVRKLIKHYCDVCV